MTEKKGRDLLCCIDRYSVPTLYDSEDVLTEKSKFTPTPAGVLKSL